MIFGNFQAEFAISDVYVVCGHLEADFAKLDMERSWIS